MIKLEADEIAIFEQDKVAVVYADRRKTMHNNVLVLTNKRIVVYKKSLFKTNPLEYSYPLDTIKIFDDAIQLKRGKFSGFWATDEESLEIYFKNGDCMMFHFDTNNHSAIIKIAEEICKLARCKPSDERLLNTKKTPRQKNKPNFANEKESSSPGLFCDDCQRTLPYDAIFCAYCGKKLERCEVVSNEENISTLFCKKCGRKLSADLNFCTGCGAEIKDHWRS